MFCRFKFLILFSVWLLIIPFSQVFAQGSITGTVSNSDMSVPADSALTFWGFLDDTDEEIRTELSDGAGYQNPYWWDDFQNYGTEASGNPYDYLFSNLINAEAYHLAGLIPNNSYQEENIVLASVSNPSKPAGVMATVASTSRVVVRWNKVAGITYHIYRRFTSSNGSLFRLDDPSGSLSNPGVSDSFFVDTTVNGASSYTYMVIGEDASGNYTPHSDEATANSSTPAVPLLTSIFPNTGPTAGGTFVTIEGENFDQDGVRVTIGSDTATSVIVVSPFEITCLTPAGSAGSSDVMVTNIASGLDSSPLVGGFTYYLNTPPIADAGPDQTGVIAGSLVTLDGSGSFDMDGDSLGYHWSQISGPSVALSDSNGVNPTFTPDTGGTYYFQLYVDDAIDYSQADTVLIAVENQPPVLDSIGPKFVDEGQTLEFRVSATDPDGDSVILSAENVPTNATFVDSGNGAGSFTFNPDYTQDGLYNVTFIASDGSLADSEIVVVTVNDVNRTPVLDSTGTRIVDEGGTLEFRVSASDPDADALILSAENVPANATFVDSGNGAGSFTFNPDYTQAGLFGVTFIASDGSLADSELVSLTVNDVNQAPVLDSIGSRLVDEGQILEFRISSTDLDGDIITLSTEGVPLNATFTDSGNGAGSFTFNPDYTQAGIYDITFIASDGLLADSELVQVTVNEAGNQAPVLDSIGSRSIDEGQTLEFRIHASDLDNDSLILSAIDVPVNATLIDSGNGSGSFTFNPDYDQAGIYNVTFIASDGSLADSEVVAITVNHINQAPVLDSIGFKLIDEGQTLEFRVSSTDPDGDAIILTAEDVPLNAAFVDSGNGAGSFTFSPDYTQAGLYSVTFIASDGSLADSESVSITVNEAGNQVPVLDSIRSKSVDEEQTLSFRVHATDPDLDSLILSAVDVPTNASFFDSGNGAGSFTFDPDYTQAGLYNVTFIASDGFLADSELVEITVAEAGNQTPVMDSIGPQSVDEGDTLIVVVSASDPDDDSLVFSVSNQPSNSTFMDSGNGKGVFTFTPDYYQSGVDTVTFLVMEKKENPLSDYENVIITIIDINQPPVFDSIGPQNIAVYETLSLRVVATDPTDPDGGPLHLTAAQLPLNSTFTDSGGGIGGFVFAPDTSQIGTDTVIFNCTDEGFPPATGQEMVIITVQEGVNQAPTLEPIGSQLVVEAETLSFIVSASDPNGTIPVLYTSSLPRNSTFVDSGNGRGLFTFTPDYAQQGLKEITFYASDGELVDFEYVLVQITDAGNQRPILDSIGAKSVTEGDTLTFSVYATDPDSTIPALYAENLPVNANLVDNGDGGGTFTFTPVYIQSGIYSVIFLASDGELSDSEVVEITVNDAGNQTPVMSPIDSQVVEEGQNLVLNLEAVDPDSTIPFLRAWNLPDNATFTDIGDGTGVFDFTPTYLQDGVDTVIFEAVDYEDTLVKVTQSVQITTRNVNRLPVFQHVSTQEVNESDTVIFNVTATDPDGAIPALSCVTKPQNSIFVDSGNGVGTFSFFPDYSQSGVIYPVFLAVDHEYPAEPETAAMQVQIVVYDVPQPPVWADIPDTSVAEGDTLTLVVSTSDPDGVPPVLSATGLPTNSSFTDNEDGTGTFAYTPNFVQAGTSWVTFIATDPTSLADTEEVRVVVIEAGNQPPILASIQPEWVIPAIYGDSFTVHATDPDSTVPVLTASQLPYNASFYDSGNGIGLFRFIPDTTQADSVYQIIFIASDGFLADSQAVVCSVIAYQRGDANGDRNVSIVDVVYLINYLFNDGPAPLPWGAGDANGDGNVSIVDVVYLINYLFNDGPPPP